MTLLVQALGAVGLVGVGAILTLAWGRILGRASEDRGALELGLMTLTLMTLPLELARFTESIVSATIALAGLAALSYLAVGPREAPTIWPRWPTKLELFGLGVLVTLVGFASFLGNFWDESNVHLPVTGAIARGVSPVVNALYPSQRLPYHYGFDVLAAEVRAFSGVSTHLALDVAGLWLFVLLLLLGAELGRALGAPEWLAAALLPMGSGVGLWLFFQEFGSLELPRLPFPGRWYQSVPPGTISNFFQHPQGAGMPAFLVAVLLDTGPKRELRRWLVALSVGALCLAHVIYFGVAGLALGAAACVRFILSKDADRIRTLAMDLVSLVAGLALAFAFGGALRGLGHSSLVFGSQLDSSVLLGLVHHVLLFSPQIIVLIWVGPRRDPLRAALWFAAVVGFVVPNVLVYQRSWDIVKFHAVALFVANALVAELAGVWWARGRRALAVGLVVSALSSGTVWLLRVSILDGKLGVPAMQFGPPARVYRELAEALGPLVPPREAVFATNLGVAGAGGFLTPGFAPELAAATHPYDLPPLYQAYSHHARIRRSLDVESLDALRIRWLVMSPGDMAALAEPARSRLADGNEFEKVLEVEAEGERLVVFRRK
ncbi:MAG: hypothetical protein HY791_17150 [Deltaproteobacteria bacterium]|nr:hypothetical protein [Deltaproteobacteria bacterium]